MSNPLASGRAALARLRRRFAVDATEMETPEGVTAPREVEDGPEAQQTDEPAASTEAVEKPMLVQAGERDNDLSGWFLQETGELFRGFPVSSEDTVADVGCGEGGYSQFCAAQGASVVSVDVDPDVVSHLAERLEGEEIGGLITTRVSDGADLPLEDEAVSRVVCTEVLEHVDDPGRVLEEMVRIGRPGALYLLTVPGALQEHMQKNVAHPSYFQKPNHIRIVEHEEFDAMISDAGLEILEHTQYGFYWSIWFALFWACGVELGETHPVLESWGSTWNQLLDMPKGKKLKHQLDSFMPKSQVILARKPGGAPAG